MSDRWSRRAPLTGLVFVGLLVACFALSWNTPDDKASGAKVISYFHAHRSQLITANVLGAYAVIFWLFFTGSLRSFLRRAGASEGLVTTAFGGAIVFGVGGAILSALSFTLANEINRLDAQGAHTLNLLSTGVFFPIAAGQAVFAISSAIAILRTRALPAWLGWLAIVLGVVSITPVGFFATFVLLLWSLIVSVLVYRSAEQPASAPAVAAPREPVGAPTG
jgi:MFS family permease